MLAINVRFCRKFAFLAQKRPWVGIRYTEHRSRLFNHLERVGNERGGSITLMANLDSRGLSISTTSEEAACLYREGVDLLISAWPGAIETWQASIAADPDFALAHAALARANGMFEDGAGDEAGRLVGTARPASASPTLSTRHPLEEPGGGMTTVTTDVR